MRVCSAARCLRAKRACAHWLRALHSFSSSRATWWIRAMKKRLVGAVVLPISMTARPPGWAHLCARRAALRALRSAVRLAGDHANMRVRFALGQRDACSACSAPSALQAHALQRSTASFVSGGSTRRPALRAERESARSLQRTGLRDGIQAARERTVIRIGVRARGMAERTVRQQAETAGAGHAPAHRALTPALDPGQAGSGSCG